MRLTATLLHGGFLFLALSPAIAQTTAPSAAPATTSTDGMGWLWIIVLLALVGAGVWYFMRNKASATTSTSRGNTSMGIGRDRVAGSAEQVKGSIKEGVGDVLGDAKLQAEGKLDKAHGKAQNTAGGMKETLRGG
jgi:uncharacterized protein YjbJ (UPF0337 family)